jgi:hypothetical protein
MRACPLQIEPFVEAMASTDLDNSFGSPLPVLLIYAVLFLLDLYFPAAPWFELSL